MGDRANVVIKSKGFTAFPAEGEQIQADLVLYTHWSGYRVESIVQKGLAAAKEAGRLTDDSYGSRIIVETFFAEHSDKALGAGIYVGKPWEPHVVVIDLDAATVEFDPAGNEYGPEAGTVTESIEDFLSRSFATVDA